jgi:hypothetical protein
LENYSVKTSVLHNWHESFRKSRNIGRTARARRRRQHLSLEALEDRISLSLAPQIVRQVAADMTSHFSRATH